MKVAIQHTSPDCQSYRAACARSLFNVESSAFSLTADLPFEAEPWQIGLVVGPSGSGKSSLGARIWGQEYVHTPGIWPQDQPIIDAISPDSPDRRDSGWQTVTGALSAVGLGDVPAWLRPYHVLSTGEKFRAEMARLVCEAPPRVVVDEFTSVVDRQVARVGASAFAKAWRRTGGQAVCLSCHYDIAEWLAPDWIFDTASGQFTWTRGCLRRPSIQLDICEVNWQFWPLFEPHHYLKVSHCIASTCYVALCEDRPIAHLAMTTRPGLIEARGCRLVVLPEWQGVGIGMRFLSAVCDLWRRGQNRHNKPLCTLINTSHPGLAAALRKNPLWTQVSARLHGQDKTRSFNAINGSRLRRGRLRELGTSTGYGGHFRAIQGFRYLG